MQTLDSGDTLETLDSGETLEVSDEDDRAQCAICLDNFWEGDEVCSSPNTDCNHVFHYDCMYQWLLKHDECPYCRKNIYLLCRNVSGVDLGGGRSHKKKMNVEEAQAS